MKIAAVVVTYNRCDMLKQCIEKLLTQTVPCDILVVDNDSTDETPEYLSGLRNERVSCLRMSENTGGAGGFNAGMHKAAEDGYELLWLLDDDTFPEKDALEKLTEAGNSLNGHYGWLSSKALWTDGGICRMNVQRITPYKDLKEFDGDMKSACMASFVSLLLPAETIRKYGYPVKEFFIWSDDWEYTRRISRHEPCFMVPDSIVTHAMKQNTVADIAEDSRERIPRYRYLYRNDVYLYRREGVGGWIWLIMKDCWHSFKVLTRRRSDRRLALNIIWSGFREGIGFLPDAETGKLKQR